MRCCSLTFKWSQSIGTIFQYEELSCWKMEGGDVIKLSISYKTFYLDCVTKEKQITVLICWKDQWKKSTQASVFWQICYDMFMDLFQTAENMYQTCLCVLMALPWSFLSACSWVRMSTRGHAHPWTRWLIMRLPSMNNISSQRTDTDSLPPSIHVSLFLHNYGEKLKCRRSRWSFKVQVLKTLILK